MLRVSKIENIMKITSNSWAKFSTNKSWGILQCVSFVFFLALAFSVSAKAQEQIGDAEVEPFDTQEALD
jgi:hypothetical protein